MNKVMENVDLEKLITAYTQKWCRRFISEGYWPDEADIQSDVSFAVARCISRFNENQQQTKFSTYAITAIKNAMLTYRRKLQKELVTVPLIEYAVGVTTEPGQEYSATIRRLVRNLSGIDRIVACELMHPSRRVVELVVAFETRQSKIANSKRVDHVPAINVAIAKTYGLGESEVEMSKRRIRQELKELL